MLLTYIIKLFGLSILLYYISNFTQDNTVNHSEWVLCLTPDQHLDFGKKSGDEWRESNHENMEPHIMVHLHLVRFFACSAPKRRITMLLQHRIHCTHCAGQWPAQCEPSNFLESQHCHLLETIIKFYQDTWFLYTGSLMRSQQKI